MNGYLIDTNICVYYLKGKYKLDQKFDQIDREALYVSEITVAELKFGAENSANPKQNANVLNDFLSGVNILPIYDALDVYAKEKARLRRKGIPIDDFDLLIGASAIANQLTLVTHNLKHFERLEGIILKNWLQE